MMGHEAKEDLFMSVHSSFICNSLKFETAQMSFTHDVKQLWYTCATEYYSAIKRRDYLLYIK